MAELFKIGDWVGHGEEKTAKALESGLPDDWVIVANVQLPGVKREDVDLLVIGNNRVFVVEEKSWGPGVLLDDHWWTVETATGSHKRRSPMGVTAQKAKKVRGLLQDRIPDAKVINQSPVRHFVIMSHDSLSLHGTCEDWTLIASLSEASEELIFLDSEKKTDLLQVRDTVIEVLTGIQARTSDLTHLGDYQILEELSNLGPVARFDAEHSISGERVTLYCFPRSENPTVNNLFERDRKALDRLAQLQRTWVLYPPFLDDERWWTVLPQARPDFAKSLADLSLEEVLANSDSAEVRRFIRSVFEGLAQVHHEDVTHRALSPDRIWLGRSRRIYFSDFHHARIDETQTLHAASLGETPDEYASPEVMENVHSATPASDVYSVGKILIGFFSRNGDDFLLNSGEETLAQVLSSCVGEQKSTRPTAEEVVRLIDELQNEESRIDYEESKASEGDDSSFGEGFVYKGKYEIQKSLGEGGASRAWRAIDLVEQKTVVIRQLKQVSEFERLKGNPPGISLVQHPNCQRHFSLEAEPGPGVQVVSFFDGQTLAARQLEKPLSAEELRAIAVNLLRVLHEAFHSASPIGLVHGDISPSNVMVDEDLNVFLIDLASVVPHGEKAGPYTPAFASPEVRAGGSVSPQSDIYSASAALLYLVLNRPLFEDSPDDSSERIPIGLTEDESAQWGRDGSVILNALFRGLSPELQNRPSRADEFANVIRKVKAAKVLEMPGLNARNAINPSVDLIRRLFVDSKLGNSGMLADDSSFAKQTYVPSKLDEELLPKVLSGEFSLVLITGNPGDGKTSFLQSVRRTVEERGGRTLELNQAVWSGELGDLSITTVFDGSESFDGKSSETVFREAIQKKTSTGNHVAVVAINDGRLNQLVIDLEDEIEGLADAYENPSASLENGPVAIVDLKRRSLISTRDSGLGLDLLDSLTGPELWEDSGCMDCASKGQCPILQNVQFLRSEGKPGIQRLALLSHLSSERRATIRDLRSAFSWAITSDWGCEDVHRERESEQGDVIMPELAVWNSIFSSSSSDKLLTEWRQVDPALLISPEHIREFAENSGGNGVAFVEPSDMPNLARRKFMTEPLMDGTTATNIGPYRFLPYYLRIVMDGSDLDGFRLALLSGLSNLSGVHIGVENGFAVAAEAINPSWRLIRSLKSEEFRIVPPADGGRWMEQLTDELKLYHDRLGLELSITLDMAELLLRASNGEIFDDAASAPLRNQALSFVNRLAQSRGESAYLLSPSSQKAGLMIDNGKIALEVQS